MQTMCIMEIHPHAARITMVQAVTHNMSTIDRDLDMLRELAIARKDRELATWVSSMQDVTRQAYALGLTEFGIEAANLASDPDGHVHVGSERNIIEVVNNATKRAKVDETR